MKKGEAERTKLEDLPTPREDIVTEAKMVGAVTLNDRILEADAVLSF